MPIRLKAPTEDVKQSIKDNAFLNWLTTPIRELSELPADVKKDYQDFFKREKPRKTVIQPPGWEDIIKIEVDVDVSIDEKKAWKEWRKVADKYGFEKLGFDMKKINRASRSIGSPPISQDQILTLERRHKRAAGLAQSPTPKTVNSIGSVLTWMDDIQDGFVTLAYLAKLGYRAMRKAAPKVAGRFVPGLGYILLAKDMFDIAKWVRSTALLRSNGKRRAFEILEALPNTTRKKLKGIKKITSLLPSFSEAVQIAQTTEVLTGYGLSLGPVVGYGLDASFGTLRGSEFRGMEKYVRPNEVNDRIKRIKGLTDHSPNLTPASLDSMRILNAIPNIMMFSPDLSFDDNLLLLTAANNAAVYLRDTGDLRDIENWSAQNIDTAEDPPTISDDVRYDLEELGIPDPGSTGLYPLLDGVQYITPRMRVAMPGTDISDNFKKWIKPHKDDPRVAYASAIIAELSENLMFAYEGKDIEIKTSLSSEARSYFLLREYDLDKKLKVKPEDEISLAGQVTDMIIRNQHKDPTYQQIDALVDIWNKAFSSG